VLDPEFAVPLNKLRELFPDLEILDLLGAGGMGAVYRARQLRLHRLVALKVLTCPPDAYEDFSLRFEREAQVLARLDHPNIVTVHDFGEIDRPEDSESCGNLFYFIMEFVDGADLSQMIRTGEMKPEQALRIVPQICEALQFAHNEGITHRDIKPANILVDKKGRVRIADFGLAKLVKADNDGFSSGLTMTGTSMGTPHYMAPEQWEASAVVDHRADIYSLGVVFYEMLTGERPHGVFDPPSRKIEVDVRIDEVVLKAMEKNVDRRYQQATEISEGIAMAATKSSGESRRKGSRQPAALWLIAAVMVTGGLTLFSFMPTGSQPDPGTSPWVPQNTEDPDVEWTPSPDSEGLPLFARAEPGRLLAKSTDPTIAPVELEAAEGIDDFVQIGVFANIGGWVGLRADGTLIRSGRGVIAKNARTLVKSDGHSGGVVHAYLSDTNQLHSLAPNGGPAAPLQLPPVRHVVVQLRPPGMHVHAILEDGSVRYFEWGKPGRPMAARPPEDVLQGLRSAVVNRDRWLLEKWDGEFSLWTPARTIDFPAAPRAVGFRAGNALVIAKSGALTFLNINAPGPPMWQTYFQGYEGAESLLVGPNWFAFRWPDGTWRFESQVLGKFPPLAGWSENITGLPAPAFALLNRPHPTQEEYAKLYWIEPVKPGTNVVATDPSSEPVQRSAAGKPGRLRGIGMRRVLSRQGGLAPLDLSATGEVTDFVQIRAKHAWGIFAALRANGEVISNHRNAFDSRSGIARLGRRSGSDQNLIYIRHDGKAISAEADRGLRIGDVPAVERPVVDAVVAESNGLLLLDDGRAVPWGLVYDSQEYIDGHGSFTSLWPKPAESKLRDVRAIAAGQGLAALVRNDGSVMAWGERGVVALPEKFASGIDSVIVTYEPKLIALDRAKRLWAWSQQDGLESITCRGRAVAIAGGDYRSPPVYQTEDGHWHLCFGEERLTRLFPGVAAAFPELKGLSADAFFISMDEKANGEVFMLWIEPVEE